MLAIKSNLMAETAARQLSKSYDSLSESVERLSSGLRINSAKDDAAGLAVRELVRADISVLEQGSRNASDAISMLQTAEGAMGVVDEILIRMSELAEQAATESYSNSQREIMDQEFSQLASEIDRIATSTSFNGITLLNSTSAYGIHIGGGATINISAAQITTEALGLDQTASAATAAYIVNSHAAASSATTWLTETSSADGTLHVGFGDTSADVTLTAGSAYTMQDIKTKINAAGAGVAATIAYDSDTNAYSLKVASSDTGTLANGWSDVNLATTTSATYIDDDTLTASNTDWTFTNGTNAGSAAVSIGSVASAASALDLLDAAIETKDSYRAKLGYMMNRLESATDVVDIQAENLTEAESRISDVDVATEMAAMTQSQVLAQAGISMLAQANSMPQMALQLLQG